MNSDNYEHSIVGALCIDQRSIPRIAQLCTESDFEIQACADVFAAAVDAVNRGKCFDAEIAADCISRKVPDAKAFIAECMDVCPSCANAEEHARRLHKKAALRRLRSEINNALADEGETSVEGLAATIGGICAETARNALRSGRVQTLGEACTTAYNSLFERNTLRIDTGFPKLDGLLKGLHGGNLVLLCARPAVGKSAFMLDLALSAARSDHKVLIFTLEMLADELAERLIARRSNVALDKLIDRTLTEAEVATVGSACSELDRLPVHICDEPSVTVGAIRQRAQAIKDLHLLLIDYAGLLRATRKHENRNLELGAISRELKTLATELRVPIVLLAQLNRAVDETEEPKLSSIRDSGELEQHANKIIFLWNIDREAGIVGVRVAKNRRGATGTVQMRFDGAHMRFVELSNPYVPPAEPKRKGGFL